MITPFFILFPASIAYAIVKYRFFRLERLISQGMVYSSLTALLALLYFAFLTVTRSASERLLGQQPQGLIEGINEEVTAFIGGEPQFDDFTLVVLKCL
ncbi:MAG: hypothetical protein WBW48_06315 [Anaerolineae bacterium]